MRQGLNGWEWCWQRVPGVRLAGRERRILAGGLNGEGMGEESGNLGNLETIRANAVPRWVEKNESRRLGIIPNRRLASAGSSKYQFENSGRRLSSWACNRATMLLCIWLTRLSLRLSVAPISFIVISS